KLAQKRLLSDVVREPAVILSSCATFSSESRRRTLVPCWTAGINGFKGAPKEPQRSPKGRVGSAKGPENAQGLVRQALPGHRGRIRRISFGAAEAFVRSAAWPVAMLFWFQRGIQSPPLDPRRTHLSDALGLHDLR